MSLECIIFEDKFWMLEYTILHDGALDTTQWTNGMNQIYVLRWSRSRWSEQKTPKTLFNLHASASPDLTRANKGEKGENRKEQVSKLSRYVPPISCGCITRSGDHHSSILSVFPRAISISRQGWANIFWHKEECHMKINNLEEEIGWLISSEMYSGVHLISNLSLLDWLGSHFVIDFNRACSISAHVKRVNKTSSKHTHNMME